MTSERDPGARYPPRQMGYEIRYNCLVAFIARSMSGAAGHNYDGRRVPVRQEEGL